MPPPNAIFSVLIVVTMKSAVIFDVSPCSQTEIYLNFRVSYYFHLWVTREA